MRRYLRLTWLLLKAYVRDRGALFFSFLVPILITAIFGVLNFGTPTRVAVGVVDEAANASSAQFVATLRAVPALEVHVGSRDDEVTALRRGTRDLVLSFPPGFAPSPRGEPALIEIYEHSGRPQQVALGRAVVQQLIDQVTFQALGGRPIALLKTTTVDANRLSYVDFLIPGMVAMSIMQLGVFSVAFGIVQSKRTGALRRLMATPLRPRTLLAAQTSVRLLMVLAQVVILVGMGELLFGYRLVGNFGELVAVGVLGGVVFLAMGFAIAGSARTEDQAAPLANLVSMPQMFLSGVFFPRDALPAWLRPIADFFPLTFLADAAREIGTQGAHLWDVSRDIVGLVVWLAIAFVAAVKLFRFE